MLQLGDIGNLRKDEEEPRMAADKYGRGELAHPRVSASSAVKFLLIPAQGRAVFHPWLVSRYRQRTTSIDLRLNLVRCLT